MLVLAAVLALPLGAVLGSYALADDPAAPNLPGQVEIGGARDPDGTTGTNGEPNAGRIPDIVPEAPATVAPVVPEQPTAAPPQPPPPARHTQVVVPPPPPVGDDDDDDDGGGDDGGGDDDDD